LSLQKYYFFGNWQKKIPTQSISGQYDNDIQYIKK